MLKYKYSKSKHHWKNTVGFGTHLQNPNGAQVTYFLCISPRSVQYSDQLCAVFCLCCARLMFGTCKGCNGAQQNCQSFPERSDLIMMGSPVLWYGCFFIVPVVFCTSCCWISALCLNPQVQQLWNGTPSWKREFGNILFFSLRTGKGTWGWNTVWHNVSSRKWIGSAQVCV